MTRTTTLLIGSIGVLTESSDLQRQAFNRAFEENGLDWHWGESDYERLLRVPGGAARIAAFAAERDADVDAEALHADKVAAFERIVDANGLTLRPGIADLIADARLDGMRLGFVTATSQRQIELVAGALKDALSLDVFDYIGDRSRVAESKPAPDIYLDALAALEIEPEEAVALEDTAESARAAIAAGIQTFVYPGQMHTRADMPQDAIRVASPGEVLRKGTVRAA